MENEYAAAFSLHFVHVSSPYPDNQIKVQVTSSVCLLLNLQQFRENVSSQMVVDMSRRRTTLI